MILRSIRGFERKGHRRIEREPSSFLERCLRRLQNGLDEALVPSAFRREQLDPVGGLDRFDGTPETRGGFRAPNFHE